MSLSGNDIGETREDRGWAREKREMIAGGDTPPLQSPRLRNRRRFNKWAVYSTTGERGSPQRDFISTREKTITVSSFSLVLWVTAKLTDKRVTLVGASFARPFTSKKRRQTSFFSIHKPLYRKGGVSPPAIHKKASALTPKTPSPNEYKRK
jgi:hypothetical protein